MKKVLAFISIFTCMNVFSQQLFSLEKSLEGIWMFNLNYEPGSYINLSLPTQSNVFYSTTAEISGNTVVYKYYDTDYNLTTEKYSFNIPNNYTLSAVSKISIPDYSNQDWFIATLHNYNKTMGDSGYCRNIIYNSNGQQIYEFKSSSQNLSVYPLLYLINNKYKLHVWRHEYSATQGVKTYTDIYCLNIEINNSAVNSVANRAMPLIQVFNTNGVLLEETDENIFTPNLSKGIYIIREGNQTRKVVLGE